ncbi:hypothetical protein PUR49_01265 [Streptomyces sp. BE147]|uniref:hypothetical protein n=1 Tax=Streptomyces sp. BE147 TaxID=3002524 RepID=UPI002E7668E4|nr:hypothetical protein [Streptomyces sp. BE147]MEE1735178.1 hypothetical protein [Streptomyces sp. BE147]
MVNWAQMYDCYGDVDRVPELLARAEREDEAAAWDELGYRLILECDLVFPASFAALQRLVRLASGSARARGLAGAIVRCAAGGHGCDDLLACWPQQSRSSMGCWTGICGRGRTTTLAAFRDLIAVEGHYHWSAVLGDFSDDFYQVACPHCAVEVTVAIGSYGRYSAIRDWNPGDVERRDLRPAPSEGLSGIGRWMHETAVRDGQVVLADGIAQLFGRAECPRCASVFNIADEYASSNRPLM